MKIEFSRTLGPAHMRVMAIDADTYDYDQPAGFGATEDEAQADLLEKLEARRERTSKQVQY